MTGAQIAVAAYGSAWAAYSTWRAWPQQCRKIAIDIWTGLTSFANLARSETRILHVAGPKTCSLGHRSCLVQACDCADPWHRSEYRNHTSEIRQRLDEVHRINEQAEATWNSMVTHAPLPGGGGGSGKATITVGGTTGINRTHPDPARFIVPGSERIALEYEYRTVVDSRLTDSEGNYRTVTQRRHRDSPGGAWEDTGFGYSKPPPPDWAGA